MTTYEGQTLVAVARAIATVAHFGQTDKGGNPYIDHPRRVAAQVSENGGDRAVAWLHDVLEDTDITAEMLRAAGVPAHIVGDVELLTRRPDIPPEDYYDAIRGSSRARRVKLADIADNTDPDRLALLDDATIARLTRKYAKARLLLGATGGGA